ncbi:MULTISPECIES: hypothetical protein [Bizionia]|uniref:Uncharacterized protein n=1 Tax=Bizionia algoritergicola TaxID=291187 RepID=A0A5D0QZ94_9FLAO|nr:MULTISPECIES: hypothetical protein [Bizionia]OBX20966.1 hypothetical protein BAA08_14605 [Bizionia sp. APA-3]TYB74583.1 hypothetical protein ES675_00115 [Bizionia algoritergicola]
MFQTILTYIIAPIVTALIAWYGSKAMTQRNLKSKDLDNEIKSAEYYQGLLDDMSARLTTAVKELMALEDRYRELLRQNSELIEQIKISQASNSDLILEIRKMKSSNNELVEELQKFKQLNGKKS